VERAPAEIEVGRIGEASGQATAHYEHGGDDQDSDKEPFRNKATSGAGTSDSSSFERRSEDRHRSKGH
jgi:hypothetical protein